MFKSGNIAGFFLYISVIICNNIVQCTYYNYNQNTIAMRNRTTTPTGHTVKKMNENVYTERRKVIDCIYKAKFLLRNNKIEMPRIDVRITETEKTSNLGVAQMNGKYIWIPAHTLNMSSLYQTVLHELCHAIWGIGHDNKCKLMHPILQNISDSEAEKIFLQYAIKHSGK